MKRLYRSKKERMPGGVCAGPGEHPDIDPTVIRLIRAVVTVLSLGTGTVVYILAWILMPEEETACLAPQAPESGGFT
ncbi:MAG: PspC domain-containing protein [Methanoregula sp.]|jgi:phage shock protein PspC (stress-responsive transcriptional regulator)|nr:PspC domain-containing protein [Methanoregula sp.]